MSRKPSAKKRTALIAASTVLLTAATTTGVLAQQGLAAPTVGVWVTTGDQSKLLQQEPNVEFGPDDGSETTVDVDDTVTHQTMDGFGASFTDSSAWLVANELDQARRDELMAKLFAPDTGIGLNMVRQPMGASDFAVNGDYTYDDTCCDLGDFSIAHDQEYIIPVLQQAKSLNPELKIMGTPWSPPAWMKTGDSLHGGSLKPESHGVFADYFVKYVQAYAAEGLPIDAITLQNEPHHETTGYPSMRMDSGEQADVLKNEVGPKFAENGINTKILAWDHNWSESNYPIEVLNDPAAKQYAAGSAFHCYEGDVGAQNEVQQAHPDKGLWFTECSGGEWSPDFAENLKWQTQNLVIGTTRNWAKGVTFWNMALDQNHGPTNGGCADCRGVVTVDTNSGDVAYNVEYYVLGHASKFVRPGAQRIDSSSFSNDIESVAFKNPDGSIAVVALNASAQEKTFKVRHNGQSFRYTLPAGAVATFTWSAAAS
ncbi:glucosylceramidase [Saccharopolyspora sp. K220]|uniref:glycoside hydrolase family 30 protein n=1 Tax=Saccharopolyspora soli TaxID=2926618 RepID=UPI001F5AD0AA|nr:glycoside hydrolase family 30 beta sandwich domain-containing protein [Saccharopolyspora soli]MCI2416348.1 glucosylceramidase [Saccharopolyspora soli]